MQLLVSQLLGSLHISKPCLVCLSHHRWLLDDPHLAIVVPNSYETHPPILIKGQLYVLDFKHSSVPMCCKFACECCEALNKIICDFFKKLLRLWLERYPWVDLFCELLQSCCSHVVASVAHAARVPPPGGSQFYTSAVGIIGIRNLIIILLY